MKRFVCAAVLCAVTSTAFAQAPPIGSCTVFPANNIWNTRVDQLPLSPSSSTWVNTIGAATHLHPDFGSGLISGEPFGIPFVLVPGTQPKFPATFLYADESDPGPYAVPVNAPIEGGSASTGDRHVITVDATNCFLYELYNAFPQTSSWKADSGAIFNLSSNALRPDTWTSADAAGLPIFPGLVRYDEVLAGEIRHAVRFTVPRTQKAHLWPARHDASSLTAPQYPPMGARFRLQANFDISTFSTANRVILTALKRYGMMLADNGSAWYISGTQDDRWDNNDLNQLKTLTGANFEAVDVLPLMIDPNSGHARQTGVSVSVTPATITVNVNAKTALNATVTNTADQTVTWDVNGTVGGNGTVGFIDSISGVYTAPASVPSPATVRIHAASHAVPAAIGSASVTITNPIVNPIAVKITPASAFLNLGGALQFSATVTNTTNTSVTWKVTSASRGNPAPGTITAQGLYQAPATPIAVTITATSVADPTKSASASVSVNRIHKRAVR